MSKDNIFLTELYEALRQSLKKYAHVEVQHDIPLRVRDQPKDLWPHADILVLDKKLHITYIIQDVDDAALVRRLAQCWPYLDARDQQDTALIQIWRHETPAGGDRRLAEFLGEHCQNGSSHFRAKTIASRIIVKMNLVVEDFQDIRAIIEGRQEDDLDKSTDIEEVFAEIERSRGLSGS